MRSLAAVICVFAGLVTVASGSDKTVVLYGTNALTSSSAPFELGHSPGWRGMPFDDGLDWRASGDTHDFDPGGAGMDLYLEFKPVNGFYTPATDGPISTTGGAETRRYYYQVWTNDLSVTVTPADTVWTLAGPTNFTVFNYGTRTGDVARTCPTGTYTVTYQARQDYYAPTNSPEEIVVTDNDAVFINHQRPYSNAIDVAVTGITTDQDVVWRITTSPDAFTNSTARQTHYTNSTLVTPVPTGAVAYAVYFPSLVGYDTPSPQTTNVVVDGSAPEVNITGAYTRQTNGIIRVSPNIDNASWNITDFPSDYTGPDSGTGVMTISNVPVGSYRVVFNPVSSYNTPSPVQQVVADNRLTDFIGNYTFTGRKLTIRVVIPGQTNLAGVGAGYVTRSPEGTWDGYDSWYYENNTDVNLTAFPTNIVVDGVSYRSFFYEWTGQRYSVSRGWEPDLGGQSSLQSNITINVSGGLNGEGDRIITVLFSREKYPWDNAGDLDGDGLTDEWERRWGLNPKDSSADEGAYGNTDGDWIPSTSILPADVVSVIGNRTVYSRADGQSPGYPLPRLRLLTAQREGVGDQRGYAGGQPFHNLLECRGLDGFYGTNGGHWTAATTYDAYWVPNDDPGTDPKEHDTDNDKFTDGWEYYFWYWRSAEAYARGLTNSANLDWVLLNPVWANPDGWDTDEPDAQFGSLDDYKEYIMGTDPTHVDTDRDGMDDYWEDLMGLDPLDASDWQLNPDEDFYAIRNDLGVLTNGTEGTPFSYNVVYTGTPEDPDAAWLDVSGTTNFVMFTDRILIGHNQLTNGMAGTVVTQQVYFGMQPELEHYLDGHPVWVSVSGAGFYDQSVDYAWINPHLKHDLVYTSPPPEPGPGVTMFDPRTAWHGDGSAPNTAAYVSYQEYLGGDYHGRIQWDAAGRLFLELDSMDEPSRNNYTHPFNQDTDGDGIPDGWELYVGLNPNGAADASSDPDGDGLNNLVEWANQTHPLSREEVADWTNKTWPTDPGVITAPPPNDPHPADTDWDGVSDGDERSYSVVVYGQARTGNLNPTSWDTDGDFLPDGWELYGGTDPGVSDAGLDYDGDGLLNWQEYWTGTVPEWMGIIMLNFVTRRCMEWDPKVSEFDEYTQYFMPPDFLSCPSFFYENEIFLDLGELREILPARQWLGMTNDTPAYMNYYTTLADNWDSDGDGMDDFWEVYHGLNPLMGARDLFLPNTPGYRDTMPAAVGSDTYFTDASPSDPGFQFGYRTNQNLIAFTSFIEYVDYLHGAGVDDFGNPVRYPHDIRTRSNTVWNLVGPQYFGLPMMDPDGDGLPNLEEYSYSFGRSFYHTNPTPLWRTDKWNIFSFINQNYVYDRFTSYPFHWDAEIYGKPFAYAYMEGFDTDNDGVGDYHEINKAAGQPGNDPLDPRNPLRNRALHFDGRSFARTPDTVFFPKNPAKLTRFCVEAWIKPENTASAANQVIVERAGSYRYEFLNFSRANFRMGLTNGLPYILYNGRGGMTTHQATADLRHRVPQDEWTHLAGVYDGTMLILYVNGEQSSALHTTEVPATGLDNFYGDDIEDIGRGHAMIVGARDTKLPKPILFGTLFAYVFAYDYYAGFIDEVRVWDGARSIGEIRETMNRRLSNDEVKTLKSRLFAYYTFDDVPDPDLDGIVPFGLGELDPDLKFHPTLGWWRGHPQRSEVYTGSAAQPYNYIVMAQNHVAHVPRQPPTDDYYHFSTNYLGTNAIPDDYVNPYNPYGWPDDRGVPLDQRLWLFVNTRGVAEPSWLPALDPDNPDSTDSDGDGLPDWWETQYGLDPHDPTGDNGAWGDPDGDGLSNWGEYMAGTDPHRRDTNGDGRSDYDSRSGDDPYALTWGELYDAGDGIPALWKYEHGMDPLKAVAHLDPDGDGWSNLAEYMAGTNPNNSGSYPRPRISGNISYFGTNAGSVRVWGYQTEAMDGVPVATASSASLTSFTITGFKEGPVYLFAFLDLNNNNNWNEGEPCGIAMDQPLNLSWSDIESVRVGLADSLPGYHRFSWPMGTGTNALNVRVNRTGKDLSYDAVVSNLRLPRNFMHEWDYRRAGTYGLIAGTYRWWAGSQNDTFYVPYYPEPSAKPVLEWPRGDSLHYARNQIIWSMDTNSTMYHLQVARKETDGRLTIVADAMHPAPYRDKDGLYRDFLPDYAAEWGDGVYYWRIAGWNPAGASRWSGDDLSTVQTFTLNTSQEYARSFSGNIHYFGKVQATNLYVEVFDNSGFSGDPVARVRLRPAFTREPNKVFPYNVRGLKAGRYYVRAFIDTIPAGGTASGAWEYWKTQGFVRSQDSFYQHGLVDLTDSVRLVGRKIVLRDRDTDGDIMPDAWEMEYFGNLNQTGEMDFDGDGIKNIDEYRYAGGILNPAHWDTDGDGLSDAFEMRFSSASGLRAGRGGLSPTTWDSDGDGYSDGAEMLRYNTDPLDPNSYPRYRPLCYGPLPAPADFDGDGRTDAALFDPASGMWHVLTMAGEGGRLPFGDGSSLPLTGDFLSDGRSELALYQPSSGYWYVRAVNGWQGSLHFGDPNMLPVPADYSGDTRTDFGLFDRVTGTWYLLAPFISSEPVSLRFGTPTDIPVPGDYTGDGRTDLAVYTPATGRWSVRDWAGRKFTWQLGGPTQLPVPGDYDGDGRIDFAVFDNTTGNWTVDTSGGRRLSGQFGWYGVIPVPGDYDGDGRMDAAFYDPAAGMWYVYTMAGVTYQGQFGWPGALPVMGRR